MEYTAELFVVLRKPGESERTVSRKFDLESASRAGAAADAMASAALAAVLYGRQGWQTVDMNVKLDGKVV